VVVGCLPGEMDEGKFEKVAENWSECQVRSAAVTTSLRIGCYEMANQRRTVSSWAS
jgi:hypothetical protein